MPIDIPTKGYSKKDVEKVRQMVRSGPVILTGVLDATTTEEVIHFGGSVESVSYQSTDTLAGNIAFSINGQDFFDSVAFAAKTEASYATHTITAVKVTRTGGTGKMVVVGK